MRDEKVAGNFELCLYLEQKHINFPQAERLPKGTLVVGCQIALLRVQPRMLARRTSQPFPRKPSSETAIRIGFGTASRGSIFIHI